MNRCDSCLWWRQLGAAEGQCRARAPRPCFVGPGDDLPRHARWPLTLAGDGCGEWHPRPRPVPNGPAPEPGGR